MTSATSEFNEEALYAVRSEEINDLFRELDVVQKIEVLRRFDIAQAIGLRAHVLNEEAKKETEFLDATAKRIWNFEKLFLLCLAIFLILKYGTNGLLQVNDNWGYVGLAPLLFSFLLRYESYVADKKIAKINSEVDVIKFRWREVVSEFTLDSYIRQRVNRKLDCDSEGNFSLATIALKKAIVDEVSFRYVFA